MYGAKSLYFQAKVFQKVCVTYLTLSGMGKTYFILNDLLKWIHDNNRGRMIYFVNRKALKAQIEEEVRRIITEYNAKGIFDSIEQCIKIMTYQDIEAIIKRGGFFNLSGYNYIVCDECHYFFQDSLFNTNTQLSFTSIASAFNESIVIFMSATIDGFEEKITNIYLQTIGKTKLDIGEGKSQDMLMQMNRGKFKNSCYTYLGESDYSYLDIRYIESFDEAKNIILNEYEKKNNEKWLVFINDYEKGSELEHDLDQKCIKAKFIDAHYNERDETKIPALSVIREQLIDQDVLIATAVFDNGISIHDLGLRNLMIFSDRKTEFLQMLGRKRKDGLPIKLFISVPDVDVYRRRLNNLQRSKKVCDKLKKREKTIEEIEDAVFDGYLDVNVVKNFIYSADQITDQGLYNLYGGMFFNFSSIFDFNGNGNQQIVTEKWNRFVQILGGYKWLLKMHTRDINLFSVAEISEQIMFYEQEIAKYEEAGDAMPLLDTKLSWLGITREQINHIHEISSQEIMAQLKSRVSAVLNDSLGTMEKSKFSDLKEKIKYELRQMITELFRQGLIDEREKKQLDDDIRKKGRPSINSVSEMLQKCGVEYRIKEINKGTCKIEQV